MIDEPVPTMPESVPAIRPTVRTNRKPKDCDSQDGGDVWTVRDGNPRTKRFPNRITSRLRWQIAPWVVSYLTFTPVDSCKAVCVQRDLGWLRRSAASSLPCWLPYERRPQSWSRHAR